MKVVIRLLIFLGMVISLNTIGVVVLIAASSLPEGLAEGTPTFIIISGLVTLALAVWSLVNATWPDNKPLKLELVFHDWMKAETGESVYFTEKGVELSLGDFHAGTVFSAEIEVEDYQGEFEIAAKDDIVPAFYVLQAGSENY